MRVRLSFISSEQFVTIPDSLATLEPKGRKLLESRSIDYIPAAERHGGVFSQFTLWLSANLQITAIITGALAGTKKENRSPCLPTTSVFQLPRSGWIKRASLQP